MTRTAQKYIVIAKRLHPERRGLRHEYLLDWGDSYEDAYNRMYINPYAYADIVGTYTIRNEDERQAHNKSIRVVPTDNEEMIQITRKVDREIPYATFDQRRDRIREEIIRTALRKSPSSAPKDYKKSGKKPKDYYEYKAPWQEILKYI